MPTFYYVVSATNSVALPGSMPTAAEIENALNGVGAVRGSRSWLASQSRITRVNIPTRLNQFQTTFARILKFTVDAPYSQSYVDGLARDVGTLVQDALRRQSADWGPVTVTGYIGAVNGPLSWWDGTNPTGSAYNTRTRDNPGSALSGATVHDENPLGPNTAIPATPTDLEALASIGQAIGGAIGAAVGGAVQGGLSGATHAAGAGIAGAATLLVVGGAVLVGTMIWLFSGPSPTPSRKRRANPRHTSGRRSRA